MKSTRYGRKSVQTEDFALMLGEIWLRSRDRGMSPDEISDSIYVYTAMRLLMRPGNTVSVSDAGLTKFLNEHEEEISQAIGAASRLGAERNLHTRLTGGTSCKN
jgi:hypothetical protein